MSDKSHDPIVKYADYRKDIEDAKNSGKGQGLFSPIFVDLYDTVLALRVQLATAQRELAEARKTIAYHDV